MYLILHEVFALVFVANGLTRLSHMLFTICVLYIEFDIFMDTLSNTL